MPEHKGQTDELTKIKLESTIEQVLWTKNSATPGGEVGIEVFTKFVGNNSDIKIEISDSSGKNFETIKGKLSGNHFWKQIIVPKKAKDELFAEAKLSKHSLSKKSSGLHLFPLVEIKNLKWDKQDARRGDILKLTAEIKGLADGNEAEIQIWEHDADEAHDLVTKFPVTIRNQKLETEWEFVYVDDTDDIPTEEERENGYQWPEYFFRVVCAGKSNDSGLLKFKDWIEIRLQTPEGNIIPNANYVLHLPDSSERRGQTNSDGIAREEDVPPGGIRVEFTDRDNYFFFE